MAMPNENEEALNLESLSFDELGRGAVCDVENEELRVEAAADLGPPVSPRSGPSEREILKNPFPTES